VVVRQTEVSGGGVGVNEGDSAQIFVTTLIAHKHQTEFSRLNSLLSHEKHSLVAVAINIWVGALGHSVGTLQSLVVCVIRQDDFKSGRRVLDQLVLKHTRVVHTVVNVGAHPTRVLKSLLNLVFLGVKQIIALVTEFHTHLSRDKPRAVGQNRGWKCTTIKVNWISVQSTNTEIYKFIICSVCTFANKTIIL
jgi:hypothetical protein